MKDVNHIAKGIVIGAVALSVMVALQPQETLTFLLWAFSGSVLSAFFLVPIDQALVDGKLEVNDVYGFLIGLAIFAYMFLYVYKTPVEGVIFILQWLVTYNIVSILVKYLPDMLKKMEKKV